jgi:adenylate kinase family enzyme
MAGPQAILLLGPTGAGKTPLGDLLAARGLAGRRCLHFDFGAELRRIARTAPDGFSDAEVAFVREVLDAGTLLEDERWPLAERILRAFLAERGVAEADRLVLNGLPRHVGQAERIGRVLDVRLVVHLSCTADAVRRRIRSDAGGDRAGRVDDAEEAVAGKLVVFRERIAPLVEHYRARGVPVVTIDVGVDTTAEEMAAVLARAV